MISEQEIDGDTLLNLTETMVATLLPTMKQQVKLMRGIKELKTACLQHASSNDTNNGASPSTSLQNERDGATPSTSENRCV